MDQGLSGLAQRLGTLNTLVHEDMDQVVHVLDRFSEQVKSKDLQGVGSAAVESSVVVGHSRVQGAATHLLALSGKRLRPMCVLLASRVGTGYSPWVRDLAVAVELVHGATLLHDDVVDLGDLRRGEPSARAVYGNAASIFAGDWLLIEALRLVTGTSPGALATSGGVLQALFSTIEEMIVAESLQLDARGCLETDHRVWLQVVEGKTASLFRWAMFAGGTAGGLDARACGALEAYGQHLGVAFQAVDDVLDLAGDPAQTGKAMFGDLREGKMTWPLIAAMAHDPGLKEVLRPLVHGGVVLEGPVPEVDPEVRARVMSALHESGALQGCMDLARGRALEAKRALQAVPVTEATEALATVAEAAVEREL